MIERRDMTAAERTRERLADPSRRARRSSRPWSRCTGVTKSFGPTKANGDISLDIARGDVLGLVGGNGAGKSTLMRILCGVTRPDAGQLEFAGQALCFDIYNAGDAQAAGIRIVHQELSLCGNLTVAENFFLEAPRRRARCRAGARVYQSARPRRARRGVPRQCDRCRSRGRARCRSASGRWSRSRARRRRLASSSSFSTSRPPRSDRERSQQLRGYIHAEAAQGRRLHLHQPQAVRDRRRRVARRRAAQRQARLARRDDGRRRAGPRAHDGRRSRGARRIVARERRSQSRPRVRVRIAGDVVAPLGRDIELHEGEIVGLAGLEGSGQKELLHLIFAPRRDDAASIDRDGAAELRFRRPRSARACSRSGACSPTSALGRIAELPMLRLLSRRARSGAPSRPPPSACGSTSIG